MVGKPGIPSTENGHEKHGAAMVTEGLDALDEEREASMADEGGMSGAVMESQDGDVQRDPTTRRGEARGHGLSLMKPIKQVPLWYVLGGLAAGFVLTVLFRRK